MQFTEGKVREQDYLVEMQLVIPGHVCVDAGQFNRQLANRTC
jgi:hypothetical protein